MAVANMELLKRAMEREAPAVLTAGDGPARRQLMVQFAVPKQKNAQGIWAHFHENDGHIIDRLIGSHIPVALWFQNGPSMLQFQSTLLKKKTGLAARVLLMGWPEQISIIEERHQPRWMIPVSMQITAKVQVLAPNRVVEYETDASVWDIGMEGASLICPTSKKLIGIVKDAWLKVILRIRGQENSYAALYRHMSPASDSTMRMGVQFIPSGDPSAAAAQAALVKFVTELEQMCGGTNQVKPTAHAA